MNETELIKLAHVMDAAWIMALWQAINGGDPPRNDRVLGENESLDLAAIALVARLGELQPEAYKTPGASLSNLAKLGISVTATLSDERVFELRGPDDFKLFAETLRTSNEDNRHYFWKLCLKHQYLERSCKILYKVAS